MSALASPLRTDIRQTNQRMLAQVREANALLKELMDCKSDEMKAIQMEIDNGTAHIFPLASSSGERTPSSESTEVHVSVETPGESTDDDSVLYSNGLPVHLHPHRPALAEVENILPGSLPHLRLDGSSEYSVDGPSSREQLIEFSRNQKRMALLRRQHGKLTEENSELRAKFDLMEEKLRAYEENRANDIRSEETERTKADELATLLANSREARTQAERELKWEKSQMSLLTRALEREAASRKQLEKENKEYHQIIADSILSDASLQKTPPCPYPVSQDNSESLAGYGGTGQKRSALPNDYHRAAPQSFANRVRSFVRARRETHGGGSHAAWHRRPTRHSLMRAPDMRMPERNFKDRSTSSLQSQRFEESFGGDPADSPLGNLRRDIMGSDTEPSGNGRDDFLHGHPRTSSFQSGLLSNDRVEVYADESRFQSFGVEIANATRQRSFIEDEHPVDQYEAYRSQDGFGSNLAAGPWRGENGRAVFQEVPSRRGLTNLLSRFSVSNATRPPESSERRAKLPLIRKLRSGASLNHAAG